MNPKTKVLIGWSSIILISLIPVILFFALGSGAQGFSSFSSSLYSLGRIFALAGITLFALTFVLSTRLKFLEDIFGGLDRVYLVHGIVGGIAFMLILAHPILIVASLVPNNIVQAASYLIPGGILSLDFGLIAIIGLISLISITFFTKMKYNHWKFTHEFMGAVFLFAVLHILLVNDSVAIDRIFIGYDVFALIVSAIGLGAFTYSLIIRKKFIKYAMYNIKNIKSNKDVLELGLEPVTKHLPYQSGQFVFARFYNNKISKEPHPFSIASKSDDEAIRIIMKRSGDFTNSLKDLRIGDKVSLEGPYGRFNFKNLETKDQLWLAAGIGITPFLGMIEELEANPEYKIDLFYTFRENYIIDKEILDKIKSIKNLKFVPWNSQKRDHISIMKIIDNIGSIKNREILICGPLEFKEKMITQLKGLGIKGGKIHEEVFDLK